MKLIGKVGRGYKVLKKKTIAGVKVYRKYEAKGVKAAEKFEGVRSRKEKQYEKSLRQATSTLQTKDPFSHLSSYSGVAYGRKKRR